MNRAKKILIVDYGVSNLHSALKAVRQFSADAGITEDPAEIAAADGLILPGVGAFQAGMAGLESRGLVGAVKRFANSGKPMLGICLGAQIMLQYGHEFGAHKGLGIIPGSVVRFPEMKTAKIPHIGWDSIYPPQQAGGNAWEGSLLGAVPRNEEMYFVHSFIFKPDSADSILALSNYERYEFCAALRQGNIYGLQFHPEKSGLAGLSVLKGFVELVLKQP